MNFVKLLKTFSRRSKVAQPVDIIKIEKQCPHCANRGMIVFKDTSKIKPIIGETDEKQI